MKWGAFTSIVLLLLVGEGTVLGDTLRLIEPAGGTYRAGSTMTVRWEYEFDDWLPSSPQDRMIDLKLADYRVENGQSLVSSGGTIGTVDITAKSFAWKIPFDKVGQHDLYAVVIQKPTIGHTSPKFTVEKSLITPGAGVPLKSMGIPVTYPAAGDHVYIGDTVTIRWDNTVIANYPNVWVQICWPNHTTAAGAFPTRNTGSLDWPVNETAENDLVVSVFTDEPKRIGYSGVFSVKKRLIPAKIPAGMKKTLQR